MPPTQKGCHSFQLIDGKGEFNDKGLDDFITATNFSKCGVDYALIAIIGPQSSGKSTFMNHFGGTKFKEMNALSGRNQTTRGIWIANCATIDRPFTIAMDIEGTDSQEKGEDTTFEGKSALFALAVADTVIVNQWCHDIGRKNAASLTLLQTILQILMLRKKTPRKVKLCFILRDKTPTPLKILEDQINGTMETMWTEIATNGFEGTNIRDFFHLLVFALPSYETHRKEFKDQVAELREKIISLDREGVERAVPFKNAHKLWKSIKEEPYLNLPAYRELIAKHMCEEIANMWLQRLKESENLKELKKEVEAGPVYEFGDKLYCLMKTTLSDYFSEVQHFKELIVKEREKELKSEILKILHPLYEIMLGHVRNETFQEFKKMVTELQENGETFVAACEESCDVCKRMLEKQCKDVVEKLSAHSAGWDWLGCIQELCNEIENYKKDMPSASISKVKEEYQENIKRLQGKKETMNVLTAVSAGVGAALLPLAHISAVVFPPSIFVTLPVLAVTSAVTATFGFLARAFGKDEHKARQDAAALEERHLRR